LELFAEAAMRGVVSFFKLYRLIHGREPTEDEWAEHLALYRQSGRSYEGLLMAEMDDAIA
jgi:hypothetical protein